MRIAVLDDYQGLARSMADWDSLGAEVEFFRAPIAQEELPAALADHDVLVLMRERTVFSKETLSQLPRLKFVVTTGMKNASLDVAHLSEHGIAVSGTGIPGYGSQAGVSSTVEIAWALIFTLAKRVSTEDRALREGHWQTGLPVTLAGQTLGLLGLGRLGAQMVPPARAFGMEITAWSENLSADTAATHGVELVTKDELFARADVLSVHLVLSGRSRGLIGAEQLGLMKTSAILVNTSRGPVIDTDALIAALESGQIAGAGLDVYDEEPLGASARILTAPNTVLTPHLGYVSYEGLAGMYRQAVEDIAAYQGGEPIRVVQ